ncbi:MAG: CHAT domain-containing protein [Halioglobus sp.]
MAAELPVVFLAFANALDDHLATLKEESRDIFRALQPLERDGSVAIHREESAQFDELYRDLITYNDRIVIFHYGGHADGTMLQLEGGVGGAGGIAGLLGQQTSLKLVFLNGCATRDQVRLLHQVGVPAVIATSVKINDTKATKLSTAFYSALADGQSIFEAFDLARNYVDGKFGGEDGFDLKINRYPNYNFEEDEEAGDSLSCEFEWALYTRSDSAADLEQWRLPEAREGWQTQLEDNAGPIRSPTGDPLPIEYRKRTRIIDVLNCQYCGTSSSCHDPKAALCPLCGSKDTERSTAQTVIPDLLVPYVTSEEDARSIALSALEVVDPKSIQLQPLLLPCWLFDVDTRTALTAQRGMVADMHADSLELEWEDVTDTIDFGVEAFPVSAGKFSMEHRANYQDWDYTNATPVQQLSATRPFVPLELSIESGFEKVSGYLQTELAAEASDRIGGHRQKNITSDMRYKSVAARTVLLPHWCATVKRDQETASILINAQSSAVSFPSPPGSHAMTNVSNLLMNQNSTDKNAQAARTSLLVSIYSGIGIGVMVGLLMGLAAPQGADAKSVVSVFIGAVGVGLAALLGLNDRHFSTAKGLRIGSFGLAVAISALSGIYVRDNNLLSPGIAERAKELRTVFKKIDDERILGLLSTTVTTKSNADGTTSQVAVQKLDLRSGLFSAGGVDRSVCNKLRTSNDDAATSKGVLRNFRYRDDDGKLGWKGLADMAEKQLLEPDQKELLFIARDAACGFIPGTTPLIPGSEQCESISSESLSIEKLRSKFASIPELAKVLRLVDERISLEGRETSLKLLAPVLCSKNIQNKE